MTNSGRVIRIILEKVAEGMPGEGYEAGYELDPNRSGGHDTARGWYGKTAVAALFRLYQSQTEGAANLARAVTERAEIMDCVVKELANHLGEDLLNDLGPRTVYEATGTFGTSRIDAVERRANQLYEEVDALHRCPHKRRYQETCSFCPGGFSVGGFLDLPAELQARVTQQGRELRDAPVANHEDEVSP